MFKIIFVDECKVSVNMFIRAISKIDDYKSVSVMDSNESKCEHLSLSLKHKNQ